MSIGRFDIRNRDTTERNGENAGGVRSVEKSSLVEGKMKKINKREICVRIFLIIEIIFSIRDFLTREQHFQARWGLVSSCLVRARDDIGRDEISRPLARGGLITARDDNESSSG